MESQYCLQPQHQPEVYSSSNDDFSHSSLANSLIQHNNAFASALIVTQSWDTIYFTMALSSVAVQNFFVVVFGYIIKSSLIQYFYYYTGSTKIHSWKIQPSKQQFCGVLWLHPALSTKPGRGAYHGVITTFNLLMAGCFAAFVSELCTRGQTKLTFESIEQYGVLSILVDLSIITMHESIVEYYWHRTMHWRPFYQVFHKMHHFYKSPEPFDDMYIHPVEAFGYYCILYSPPFLYRIHLLAFLAYMVLMGVCGVFDHSGVRISLPGIYDTLDHDEHHSKFEVNYGFPFIFMDILHGTYEGNYLGYTFKRTVNR